jgi:hypothetical protein
MKERNVCRKKEAETYKLTLGKNERERKKIKSEGIKNCLQGVFASTKYGDISLAIRAKDV